MTTQESVRQVEPGWECSGSSPSVCRRVGAGSGASSLPSTVGDAAQRGPAWRPETDGALLPGLPGAGWQEADHGSGGGNAWVATAFVSLAAVGLSLALGGVLYKKWDAIREVLPQA